MAIDRQKLAQKLTTMQVQLNTLKGELSEGKITDIEIITVLGALESNIGLINDILQIQIDA